MYRPIPIAIARESHECSQLVTCAVAHVEQSQLTAAAATAVHNLDVRTRKRAFVKRGRATWLRVARALPSGRVPARNQREWLHHVDDALDAASLRADARANIRAVAVILARHASWHAPMVTRPTWAGASRRTGLSRSTVAAHLRWLREHHLIASWTPGRSAFCRPALERRLGVNQAAEYLLIAKPAGRASRRARGVGSPRVGPLPTRTPTGSRRELVQNPPRARDRLSTAPCQARPRVARNEHKPNTRDELGKATLPRPSGAAASQFGDDSAAKRATRCEPAPRPRSCRLDPVRFRLGARPRSDRPSALADPSGALPRRLAIPSLGPVARRDRRRRPVPRPRGKFPPTSRARTKGGRRAAPCEKA
jgi:hypothetical protein